MARGLAWTDHEREHLRRLVEADGMSVAEAASVIGRSESSAYQEARKLGIRALRRKRNGTRLGADVRDREGWRVPPEVTRFWQGWDAKRAGAKEDRHA